MLAATATDRDAGGGCGGMPVATHHKKGAQSHKINVLIAVTDVAIQTTFIKTQTPTSTT